MNPTPFLDPALRVNLGMLVLCAALLVLMVRSFIAARRAGSDAP